MQPVIESPCRYTCVTHTSLCLISTLCTPCIHLLCCLCISVVETYYPDSVSLGTRYVDYLAAQSARDSALQRKVAEDASLAATKTDTSHRQHTAATLSQTVAARSANQVPSAHRDSILALSAQLQEADALYSRSYAQQRSVAGASPLSSNMSVGLDEHSMANGSAGMESSGVRGHHEAEEDDSVGASPWAARGAAFTAPPPRGILAHADTMSRHGLHRLDEHEVADADDSDSSSRAAADLMRSHSVGGSMLPPFSHTQAQTWQQLAHVLKEDSQATCATHTHTRMHDRCMGQQCILRQHCASPLSCV